MRIQYTEISESKDVSEVEILIADHPDIEQASSYIEMRVSLPKQHNPLFLEVQLNTLRFARDLIDEKMKEVEARSK